MIGQDMINRLYDCQVVDPTGEKIGSVKRIWLDGRTGDPVWASVHTGLFGLKESFVPLQRAELHDDQLRVPVDKEQVKESPKIEATNDNMTDDEQAALYRHYGFGPQGTSPEGPTQGQRRAGTGQRGEQRGGAGQRGQRPGADQPVRRPGSSMQPGEYPGDRRGQQAMTRSEERLNVGTERVETGTVRLVKHVVTEEQQVRVPVSHEEVRVEREPITDANRDEAMRGKPLGEAEHEVTLHAEKPVVNKETVPVEQVRMSTEQVAGQETVSGTVRKEQIEVQDDRDGRRR